MRLRFIFFALLYFFLSCKSFGQNILKENFNLGKERYTYFLLRPTSIKGIVILFPGRSENPKGVLRDTQLPAILRANGYLTISPALHYSLFADSLIRIQLSEILRIQSERNKLQNPDLIIGGFSAGGSVAISYAEYLVSKDLSANLKCIFVIDSPLDLQRLYASSERLMNYKCGSLVHQEGQRTKDYLDRILGGSPRSKMKNYLSISPFLADTDDGANAKWLKNIPIRLYTEPDIEFVKNKFCTEMDIEDLNFSDLKKLSEFLLKGGNKDAELIITEGQGYHSWNIADPIDLVNWIIEFRE